jgi:hypothetical protein
MSIPTTAGSRAVKIHVRDSPKVNVFCALGKERVYGPFFFMEMTITGIVYLDMLQQLLFLQLDPFTSSKMAHPLTTLEKCASTSTPVSQVGGVAELRQ